MWFLEIGLKVFTGTTIDLIRHKYVWVTVVGGKSVS